MIVPVPTHRVLAGVAATISVPILDQDGELNTSVSSGVTATCVRSDGTAVAMGSVTAVSGVASVSLTAAQTTTLDILTVTWTIASVAVQTSVVEVVGAYWVTMQEIRECDPSISENPGKFSRERLLQVRTQSESLFESATGRAFVPRYRRHRMSGSGTDRLVLPEWDLRQIRTVQIHTNLTQYTPWLQSEVDSVPSSTPGIAVRTDGGVWAYGRDNVVVEWEHGADAPPPDLKDAFLKWCRYRLNSQASGIPDRATGIIDGAGNQFRIATPGIGKSITGLPEVDEVLMRYRRLQVGVA